MLYEAPVVVDLGEADLDAILDMLRDHGLDTTYYRRSFLKRRVTLRIRQNKASDAREYLSLLEGRDATARLELVELTRAISLDVTEFLRNPEVWVAIKNHVFKQWVSAIDNGSIPRHEQKIRILSAGSSLGCEPYSFAILFHELLGSRVHDYDIRVNAIDINARTLERAKMGNIYDKTHMRNFTPAQVNKYFTFDGKCHVISDDVREMVDFSILDLNLIGEIATWKHFEPFNLIACRNVLIYFDKEGQHKIIRAFHDLLKECAVMPSYLVLGKTEGIYDKLKECFQPLDLQTKIYARVNGGASPAPRSTGGRPVTRVPVPDTNQRTPGPAPPPVFFEPREPHRAADPTGASPASFFANLGAVHDGSLFEYYTYPFIWKKIASDVFPPLMQHPAITADGTLRVMIIGNGIAPVAMTCLAGWHHALSTRADSRPRLALTMVETTPEFLAYYREHGDQVFKTPRPAVQVRAVPPRVLSSTFIEKNGQHALKPGVMDDVDPPVFMDFDDLRSSKVSAFPLVLLVSRFKLDQASMDVIAALDHVSLVAGGGFVIFHPQTHFSKYSLDSQPGFTRLYKHVAIYRHDQERGSRKS